MRPKRILIVDDSCMYQRVLTDVIDSHPGLEVVGVATNGKQALDMVASLRPDLMTLDILMPELDGIQTLLELKKKWPEVRTIMVSSLTSEGSDAALDALALGANEYAEKPVSVGGIGNIRMALGDDLLPKIEGLCGIEKVVPRPENKAILRARPVMNVDGSRQAASLVRPEILLIGVSTGGPDALSRMLPQLPAGFSLPVCIVQHMPAEFTTKLASRLDAVCPLTVREACDGDQLRRGTIYIAPGDYHMVLKRADGRDVISLNQNPTENSCRPSVDPLFRSAAALFRDKCLGLIMTGMGQDGLKGSEALYAAGSSIIVQDQDSCIVWGMPKLVAQAGLADEQVPLNRLASVIVDRVNGVRPSVAGKVTRSPTDAANASKSGKDKSQGSSL